jgi:uncharacterized protein with beta-barrel porin domain
MPSTNGHGPKKRAFLYARVSTDEQAKSGYSLAQQIDALRAYAAREWYEVVEEVEETRRRSPQSAARGGASSSGWSKALCSRRGAVTVGDGAPSQLLIKKIKV